MGDLGRDVYGVAHSRGIMMRRLVALLVLFFAGTSVALAVTNYPDRGAAYAGCMAAAAHVNSFDDPGSTEYGGAICQHQAVSFRYVCFAGANGGPPNDLCNNIPGGGGADPFHLYPSAQECPTGTVWDAPTNQCFDPQRCLAKNDSLGSSISVYDTDTHGCNDGCAMSMGADYESETYASNGQTRMLFRGKMRFTGAACAATPEKAPDTEPECTEVAGQSVCKRPDGKMCQQASTGKYICWNPGETGEKTDGPVKQKRNAGNEPIPPSLSLPNGDSLVQSGNPVTTTTSTVTNNSTTNNITTTTTNYTTQNGTNASGGGNGGDSGQDPDGEGEGEEDDEDGETASGGGSCAAPPVCSKPDSIECIQLQVDWQHACDAEQQYGAGFWSGLFGSMTSSDDASGDGTTQPGAAAVLGVDGQGDLANHREVKMIDGADLDDSGFLGGGSCPQFPAAMAGPVTLPIDFTKICDLLGNVGQIVLAVAYFVAIRIIATGGAR